MRKLCIESMSSRNQFCRQTFYPPRFSHSVHEIATSHNFDIDDGLPEAATALEAGAEEAVL